MTTTNADQRSVESPTFAGLRIPWAIIGAIVTLALTAGGFAAAWGRVSASVAAQQAKNDQQDKVIEAMAEKVSKLYESQAGINAKLDSTARDVSDIKADVRLLVRNGNSIKCPPSTDNPFPPAPPPACGRSRPLAIWPSRVSIGSRWA